MNHSVYFLTKIPSQDSLSSPKLETDLFVVAATYLSSAFEKNICIIAQFLNL